MNTMRLYVHEVADGVAEKWRNYLETTKQDDMIASVAWQRVCALGDEVEPKHHLHCFGEADGNCVRFVTAASSHYGELRHHYCSHVYVGRHHYHFVSVSM